MITFFYSLLVAITDLVPGHYVWVSIVIITILLRLAFLRSAVKMTHMQHKQKNLQPKINELKEKHAGDKQAEQKAMMELYKQEGVNPLSSCLPMIVQIVVLIGFYQIFTRVGLGPIKPEYLYSFTPRPDALNSSFFGLDLAKKVMDLVKIGGVAGAAVYLFPILTGASQLIQSLQMRALQPVTSGNDKSAAFQKSLNSQMIFLFPIMTAYISYTLAAALSIYWITQTVFMIVQQKYVMDSLKKQGMIGGKNRALDSGLRTQEEKKTSKSVFKKGDVTVTVRKKND